MPSSAYWYSYPLEALSEPDQFGCSQSTIRLNMGTPKEELGEGLKELKGFATIERTTISTNQTPQSSQGLNYKPKNLMVGLMAPAVYVAEDGLAGHQWEERPLVL